MSPPNINRDEDRRRLLHGALRNAKLEHAGVVSGTSVLLSAIIVLIYVIPVMLVHRRAFIVAKLSPETRTSSWQHPSCTEPYPIPLPGTRTPTGTATLSAG